MSRVPALVLREDVSGIAHIILNREQQGKRFFYRQIEQPIADAYRDAAALITAQMLGDDALEGVSAFVEKRKPQWPQ